MSDEPTDEPNDEEFDEDALVEEDLDPEGVSAEEIDSGAIDDPNHELDSDEDDDEDDDEAGARPVGDASDEEEEDDDELEADLDAILRDRIAAEEDDDEDDDEIQAGVVSPAASPTPEGLVERQDTEMHCPHCFLLIQAESVSETGECGHCGGPIS